MNNVFYSTIAQKPDDMPAELETVGDWVNTRLDKASKMNVATAELHWPSNNEVSTYNMLYAVELYLSLHQVRNMRIIICTNKPEALRALNHKKIPEFNGGEV